MPFLNISAVCNKNCSFCFADYMKYDTMQFMSMDLIENILSKKSSESDEDKTNPLFIAGGEPTLHPNFSDILDMCKRKNLYFGIFSNLIFNQRVLDSIISHKDNILGIGVNGSSLSLENIDMFVKNYSALNKHISSLEMGFIIDDKTLNHAKFKDYFEFVYDKLYKLDNKNIITEVKICQDLVGSDEKRDDFYFLSEEFGEYYIMMLKIFLSKNIYPHIDYRVFRCQFDSEEKYKFVQKFVDPFVCGTNSILLPDGTASSCYANTTRINIPIEKYQRLKTIQDETKLKLDKMMKSTKSAKKCSTCQHYRKSCDGPCLAFFKVDKNEQ